MRFAVAVISVTGSMIERMKKLLNIDAMKISPAVSAIRPIMRICRSTFFSPVTYRRTPMTSPLE